MCLNFPRRARVISFVHDRCSFIRKELLIAFLVFLFVLPKWDVSVLSSCNLVSYNKEFCCCCITILFFTLVHCISLAKHTIFPLYSLAWKPWYLTHCHACLSRSTCYLRTLGWRNWPFLGWGLPRLMAAYRRQGELTMSREKEQTGFSLQEEFCWARFRSDLDASSSKCLIRRRKTVVPLKVWSQMLHLQL